VLPNGEEHLAVLDDEIAALHADVERSEGPKI
jgi:hypothetical protein